jgi:group I intron endonuclease
MIGIYKITNPKGAIYIGQSTNIENRKYYYSKKSCYNQPKLYSSIEKYGFDNHKFEIIWLCKITELNYFERKYQLKYNVISRENLNLRITTDDDRSGHLSNETKLKLSIANTGANSPSYGMKRSEETKKKMSNALMGNKRWLGKTLTEEHRQKISKANIGKSMSKKLINTETGEIYVSINQAAMALNMNYSTLKNWMRGKNPNKSKLKRL